MTTTQPRHRYRSLSATVLGLLLWALLPGTVSALETLSTEHDGKIGENYLSYRIASGDQPNSTATRENLLQGNWQAVTHTPVNLGFIDQPVWFRLRLHNPSDRLQQRYLEIAYPLLDEVHVYVLAAGSLQHSSTLGDAFPFHKRPIDHPTFLERLQVNAGETIEVLVRVKSISSLQFPVALWHGDTLLHTTAVDMLLNGLYYGTLLVMLIYNLFAYVKGRESKYLHYALYISCIGTFFACMSGIGFQFLWPWAAGITKQVIVLSLAGTVLFACLFARSFLGLAGTHPKLDRIILFICGNSAFIAMASVFLPYGTVIKPLIVLVVTGAVLVLLCGFVRLRDGYPAATLFCLAWIILGSGAAAMAANKLGWIPRNAFTEYTVQLGSMVELILLSLALIQQITIERRDKYAAQKAALDFERQANHSRQQALLVQQQAAKELEERVQQRTLELQIANDKLSTLSITDALTGLKNRRFFNQRLVAEFARSKRDGTPISVLIIDVDHFKPVNDTHGHLLGDEVLKLVAQRIETEARRESDIVTRHGGEEFSVVLINNTPGQALDMAERIRRRVAGASYDAEGLSLRCTVSVGVATMTPDKHSAPEHLIQQADAALYRSKSEGRNRVSVFSQQAA